MNRMTAFTLQTCLRKRMVQYEKGTHDGSVDLLISGCEVSLWLGEQFAADLHKAFPKLKIVTLSANKLLGQLGQGFLHIRRDSPSTSNRTTSPNPPSCSSHSGGTFATSTPPTS